MSGTIIYSHVVLCSWCDWDITDDELHHAPSCPFWTYVHEGGSL